MIIDRQVDTAVTGDYDCELVWTYFDSFTGNQYTIKIPIQIKFLDVQEVEVTEEVE